MRTTQRGSGRASAIRLAAGYNAIPNFFWSVLHLGPVTVFCFTKMEPAWLYIFLGAAILSGLVPNSFLDRIQLGSAARIYKRVGIMVIRRYSQDGDWINRRIQRRYPGYKVIGVAGAEKKYIQRTYIFERFHFIGLCIFLFTAVYAIAHGHGWWALLICFSNLLYNLYPMWLQQYNRLRLRSIIKRRGPHPPSA
ncbi:MAG TPA: hypothetical protein VK563_14710 [Puia sp.]|nr:hypothetical protein [Puia sp.]